MIRRLRKRHQVMTAGLALAVAGAAIGLASRPTDAVMAELPPPLSEAEAATSAPLRSGDDLWEGAAMATTLHPDQIVLSAIEPLRRPDCLLYWTPSAARDSALPDGVRLIGVVADQPEQRLPVPAGIDLTQGHLLIYSLGHAEVFAWLPLGEGAP